MEENQLKRIEEALEEIKVSRQEALKKSQDELSKVNSAKDPQLYADGQAEVKRRNDEVKAIEDDIKKFNEIKDGLKGLGTENLEKEYKEKEEKLNKAKEALSKIDERKSPKEYKEGQEEVARRQEEFEAVSEKLKDTNKKKTELYEALEKLKNRYKIKEEPKKESNTDNKEVENLRRLIDEKNKEIRDIKSRVDANGGKVTPEQAQRIVELRKEIRELRRKINEIENRGKEHGNNDDKKNREGGNNGQTLIRDKNGDQKRIEDKNGDQKRIEDKNGDQKLIEDEDDDRERIEDGDDDQKRIEDNNNGQKLIEDKRKDLKRIEYNNTDTRIPENRRQEEEQQEEENQQEGENQQQLPVQAQNIQPGISFFEVVAKTDTVHIGNIEGKMHSLAHAPLFRTGIIESIRKGDPVGALTGLIPKTAGSILMFGPKIVSKIACAVRGTNRKFEQLQNNINNLSPEEFEVLTGDNGPLDYSLNQTTMTQFKFNDKYLEAINCRVQREKQQEKAYYANITRQIDQQIDAIKSELATGRYSHDDALVLSRNLTDLGRQKDALENEAQKAESKRLAFEDGMELKSSRKKNIPGWIAAVRNPDNIKEHKQMAEYSRIRREARESGDFAREFQMDEKLEQYINSQTSMKLTHISRGKYQKADVDFSASREDQSKGREILSSAAIVSSILAFERAIQIDKAKVQNQNDLNDQINQHNADIAQHNNDLANQNQSIQSVKGHHISDKTVNEAVNYQRHTDAANIRASGEVEALNTTAAKTGRGWASVNEIPSPIDDAIHKAQASTIGDVPMGSSTQTYINEFNQSIDNMYKATDSGRIAEAAYQSAGGHAPFDVTQYMDSTAQSMSYSASMKTFFEEALKQNDALAKLAATPVTMANTMGNFTINIPSALIPTFTSMIANFTNAYRESNDKAIEIINAQRRRERAKEQQQQQQQRDGKSQGQAEPQVDGER